MESSKVSYEEMLKAFTDYEKKVEKENNQKKYTFKGCFDDTQEIPKSPLKEKENKENIKPKYLKLFKIEFEGENRPKNLMEEKIRKMFNVENLKKLPESFLLK